MKDEEMAEEYCNHLQSEMLAYTPENPRQQRTVSLLDVEEAFLAGLKAGRPQWHKVADGDLPKDKEYVLVYTDLNNYYVAEKVDNHFMSKGFGFIPMSAVIAWCEIPTFDKE